MHAVCPSLLGMLPDLPDRLSLSNPPFPSTLTPALIATALAAKTAREFQVL